MARHEAAGVGLFHPARGNSRPYVVRSHKLAHGPPYPKPDGGIMESSPKERLYAFKPRRSYFVGIDSDGCVFDSTEIKHKECFIPNIINYW
jgi:hypothetical protein